MLKTVKLTLRVSNEAAAGLHISSSEDLSGELKSLSVSRKGDTVFMTSGTFGPSFTKAPNGGRYKSKTAIAPRGLGRMDISYKHIVHNTYFEVEGALYDNGLSFELPKELTEIPMEPEKEAEEEVTTLGAFRAALLALNAQLEALNEQGAHYEPVVTDGRFNVLHTATLL